MSHAKYNGIARFRSGREGAMCNAKYNGNLAEAALAVLATTEHVSLTALANLRTTSHRLCDSITGHMPGKFRYNLVSRPDKIKLRQVQALHRLAGSHIEFMSADVRFTTFLHLLPNLRRVELQTYHVPRDAISNILDLGSLVALTSLHTLSLQGGGFVLEQLDSLTQLKSLSLAMKLLSPIIGPLCQLPCSLTSLNTASTGGHCRSRGAMSLLLQFQGLLQSLTLDVPDMRDLTTGNPAKLSAFACLQQLTHLHFAIGCDELNSGECSELNLPKLQSLHAEFEYSPNGPYPQWQLRGCPELHRMTLVCYDHDLYGDDGNGSRGKVDLRGILGIQVSSLHLALHIPEDARFVAAFSAWELETVSIESTSPSTSKDWPNSQTVQDVLGCLACHVPMRKVMVNYEWVCDRIAKQRT